jgi:colanic acid biosynthesis glycosyl transferase WcaI
MRVVLVHRYFWPDTPPYAHILRQIALRLGEAGHEVTVLTCQPSYDRAQVRHAPARELIAPGVEVRRWRVLPDRRHSVVKAINLAIFGARLMVAGRRLGQIDVVMAASTPPIAIAKVGSWLARRCGARFVYHKQDIYPEVVLASGVLRPGRLASLLRWADARTDRAADRVVVLSEDMAKTVRARGVDADRVAIINNFDPWTIVRDSDGDIPTISDHHCGAGAGSTLQLVFAGHLGRFQNLESVIEAAVTLRDDARLRFHFFGDGPMKATLQRKIADHDLRNVMLYGHRDAEEVADFIRTRADFGIVSLVPGVIGTAYPSKTMSYLRNGCPVLALVEAESELARTIVDAGVGMQADPADVGKLAETLRQLAEHPLAYADARSRTSDLYRDAFSPAFQLERWLRLFERNNRMEAAS